MSPRRPSRQALALLGAVLATLALPALADERPCLAVSIPPQAWIARELAGDMPLSVEIVVPPGASPATYDPGARQLARLAQCEALVSVGVPFEKALLPRLERSFPGLRVVNGLEGIELADFEGHHHNHQGDEGHEACGSGQDPHFWLDPELATRHAALVARELARIAPAREDDIYDRLRALSLELSRLDETLATRLAPLRGREVAVYHPSFGYYLRRYGMTQSAIEVEGRDPGPRRMAEIVRTLRGKGVRVVLLQPEFASTSAQRVAEALGAPTATLDPLSGDYPGSMLAIADALVRAHGSTP